MQNEQLEFTETGDVPPPAGDATPPAVSDDAAAVDDADAPAKGEDGSPSAPDDTGERGEDEGDGEQGRTKRSPEEKLLRKIDKLTARNHAYERQIGALRQEIDGLNGEREKRDLEELRSLPVMPEALSEAERKDVKALRPQLETAEYEAAWWEKHAEDGATVGGKEYSAAECRQFARIKQREAGRIEARLDGIFDRGRERLAALMKKHGTELFGQGDTAPDAVSPPRIPAAPQPNKGKSVAKAPERAPGATRAPASAEAGGTVPRGPMSQEDAEAEFGDF